MEFQFNKELDLNSLTELGLDFGEVPCNVPGCKCHNEKKYLLLGLKKGEGMYVLDRFHTAAQAFTGAITLRDTLPSAEDCSIKASMGFTYIHRVELEQTRCKSSRGVVHKEDTIFAGYDANEL